MNKQKRTLRTLTSQKGMALVMALIITLVVFLMIASTMYVVTQSTKISAAGKRYASASEAADGAVELMKDSINLIMYGEPTANFKKIYTSLDETALLDAVTKVNTPRVFTVDLKGSGLYTTYEAKITVERLYLKALPGGRLEFARSAGGSGGTAIYFKISTIVNDTKNNSKAETSAMYRFVG